MKIDRDKIFKKYNGFCSYCGGILIYKSFQIDHLIPKRKGGTDEETNLMPACRPCNLAKSTYDIEQFREKLKSDLNRLHKLSSLFRNLIRFRLVEVTNRGIVFYFEEV